MHPLNFSDYIPVHPHIIPFLIKSFPIIRLTSSRYMKNLLSSITMASIPGLSTVLNFQVTLIVLILQRFFGWQPKRPWWLTSSCFLSLWTLLFKEEGWIEIIHVIVLCIFVLSSVMHGIFGEVVIYLCLPLCRVTFSIGNHSDSSCLGTGYTGERSLVRHTLYVQQDDHLKLVSWTYEQQRLFEMLASPLHTQKCISSTLSKQYIL